MEGQLQFPGMEGGHPVNGHLHGAQFDPAHAARLEKRDWQRARMQRVGSSRQGEVRDVGGDKTPNPLPHIKVTSWNDDLWIDPMEHGAFRKLGKYQEIPLHDVGHPEGLPKVGSPQATVNMDRVQELAEHPERGRSPRVPGELPNVIKMENGTHAVMNGNHRFLSHVMRNEMFAPARVVEGGMPGAIRYADYLRERKQQKRAAGKKKFQRGVKRAVMEFSDMPEGRRASLMRGIMGDASTG